MDDNANVGWFLNTAPPRALALRYCLPGLAPYDHLYHGAFAAWSKAVAPANVSYGMDWTALLDKQLDWTALLSMSAGAPPTLRAAG